MRHSDYNSYTELFWKMVKKMTDTLNSADEDGIEPIKESDFTQIVDHYQRVAKESFKNWKAMKHKLPKHVKKKASEFWPMFMKLCMFLKPAELNKHLDKIDAYLCEEGGNERLKDELEKQELRSRVSNKSLKYGVLNKLETFGIVDNLVHPTKKDVEGKVRGSMNVIKVTKNGYGDQMYRTLCIARQIAYKNRDFPFEIVRHYGNHSLVDMNVEDRSSPSGRILAQIQQKSCHNR